MRLLASNSRYHGLSLDFEDIPTEAQPGYRDLIAVLYSQMHPKNLRLYVATCRWAMTTGTCLTWRPTPTGLLLMNYDQHQTESGPGPIASQDWFVQNLKNVMAVVPQQKLICAIGSYGYDWTMTIPPASSHDPRAKRGKVGKQTGR